ncbi:MULTISPECIES: hypothetical protein [unclassified Photobacterium]|uniref:hypothetical protein n=1 Tax=unclassified Photobacterium TaxID=2628852 RepID=UPI000D15A889|nr:MULTISPECIES: hypothetical protein [unclassified Photobacterium]PSV28448.1 hypothetical protein C9J42_04660 [Photobacterium sp. GB-56]PSV30674.1 hypothetical protein C9J40_11940 [Photobacterium sp. GB-72]PSV34367.1 hypothetical protein C9J44_15645 [Photobacterium sp. GB-27]PSV40235.1 hypothetical protein C9J38_06920 [Photobacterium sp. GB-210]PSV43522.1 hypothetical protein C9J46_12060 [Photobacterium sp. GB-36]
MDFFVPSAKDLEQAESVYSSIAAHVSAPIPSDSKRVSKLVWSHEGTVCIGEVGKLPPEIFRAPEEILAIFECGDVYKICTQNRGVINFDPILANTKDVSKVEFFK